ncbi:MAG: hybrid sensor histidine kinase/response regulator [Prochlorothrix sp.]
MSNHSVSILVVDDEPRNLDVIEVLLSRENYELNYVSSGQDALNSLGEIFNPDLILLDVMMPDMDGLEVCRRIKARSEWQAIPIIMITALTEKEDLARCLNAGADDFISKPLNGLELRARVQSMVRIKQQHDQLHSWAMVQKQTVSLLEKNLDEIRGSLASTLSHELNTPLHGILCSFSVLDSALETMSMAEVREILAIAQRSAHRLEKLTQRLRDYLSLELESLPPIGAAPEPNLSPKHITNTLFMQDMALAIANQADRQPDLAITVTEAEIGISHHHLKCLVDELLDNAFKFSTAPSPIQLTGSLAGDRFILQIQDQGRGMTAEQINQIGDFVQFERSQYEQQGMGLGLKMSQRIVNLYQGKFQINSIYGQGTVISVELPVIPSDLSLSAFDLNDDFLMSELSLN